MSRKNIYSGIVQKRSNSSANRDPEWTVRLYGEWGSGDLNSKNEFFHNSYNGFTLVELLIVVSIIAIIWIASVSSFSHLFETQEKETVWARISSMLESLDESVASHEITSYEANFTSGSIGFVVNKNLYGQSDPISLISLDFASGEGTLKNTSTSTGIWTHEVWNDNRFTSRQSATASGSTMSFSVSGSRTYDMYNIYNVQDGVLLNSFLIGYYDSANQGSPAEKQVRLTAISGTTNSYDSFTVKNTLGKKELSASGTTLDAIDQATLLFEKNGKEIPLLIQR